MDLGRRWRVVRIGLALFAVIVVSSCTSGGESGGPLDFGGIGWSQVRNCQSRDERDLEVGAEIPRNTSKNQDVTLDSVELKDAEGVSLVGAYVFRMDDNSEFLYGSGLHVPPTLEDDGAYYVRKWTERENLEGAIVAPGEMVNIVVAARPDDPKAGGIFDSYDIRYRVGNRRYVQNVPSGLSIIPDDGVSKCPLWEDD